MSPSPHRYRLQAPEGVDPQVIEKVLALEARQAALGVRSIYSLGHLAHMTGINYWWLRTVVSRSVDPYDIFSIRKRDNLTLRSIAAPSNVLYATQRWLLDEVFSRMPTTPFSYAYQSGRSSVQCAEQHLGATWLIKLDLKDFFHQTDERDVYHLLKRFGYSGLVSFEISRIVTRSVSEAQDWLPAKYHEKPTWRRGTGFPYPGTMPLGYLPQGAPTSGAIANVLASRLDESLQKIATEQGMVYTRYADDLTFSGATSFSKLGAQKITKAIDATIQASGYEANPKKTRIIAPGQRLELLGILVDGERLRLPIRFRNRVERHLRGLEKFGVGGHMSHCGFRDIDGMRNHISGLIAYSYEVDPKLAKSYFSRLSSAFPLPG